MALIPNSQRKGRRVHKPQAHPKQRRYDDLLLEVADALDRCALVDIDDALRTVLNACDDDVLDKIAQRTTAASVLDKVKTELGLA